MEKFGSEVKVRSKTRPYLQSLYRSSNSNHVVPAYLWRGIKTGGTSLATGCRLPAARIRPKFLFSTPKKRGGRRGRKTRGSEDALGVGGNGAIKTMASRMETRGTIVGRRKIANNRGGGGWKIRRGEDLESWWVWNGIRVRIRRWDEWVNGKLCEPGGESNERVEYAFVFGWRWKSG